MDAHTNPSAGTMTALPTGQQLRELAQRYIEAAKKLQDAADILDGNTSITLAVGHPTPPTPRIEGGRLGQLREFLRANGPLTRKEILEQTSIPSGTLGMILKKENGFAQDAQGLWLVPESDDPSQEGRD
jgi:hypothetical protein